MQGLSFEARNVSRRSDSCNRKFLGFKDIPANPLFRSPIISAPAYLQHFTQPEAPTLADICTLFFWHYKGRDAWIPRSPNDSQIPRNSHNQTHCENARTFLDVSRRQRGNPCKCYRAEIWAVASSCNSWGGSFFRGETGEETKIMKPFSVLLALFHLLLIFNSSSCDQDEVCETESCVENELSDVG